MVADDTTALIGSDASSTIRIVRPGISRRHVVLSHDGTGWKVQDAGSRNGTFRDGQRIQAAPIDGTTTLYLGHPTDGEVVTLAPMPASASAADADAFDLPAAPPPPPKRDAAGAARATAAPVAAAASERAPAAAETRQQSGSSQPASSKAAKKTKERAEVPQTRVQPTPVGSTTDVELAQLTAAIRDQISAVKGLTWSVWAMIAVTAALIVLTLFVGILSN